MASDQTLVAIGVPSGDMVHADFAMSLANLSRHPGPPFFLMNAKSSLVAIGRNQCVAAALLAKATHLLFLDSDMTFPVTTLTRLLAHDKDVVGAVYSQRVSPFHPLGVTDAGEHKHITKGMHRMRIIPTGCMLIRTALFAKIPKPWFNTIADGDHILGEDYYFCEQVRRAGFDVWCDGDLSRDIGHIGQTVYKLQG